MTDHAMTDHAKTGVTAAAGFHAAGGACGVKTNGDLDLALVVTADAQPVPTAAVFTSNQMTASPVVTSRAHLAATGGYARAVIANSGNANAATGTQGRDDAQAMCDEVAKHIGGTGDDVLVCSTGLIGIPLPIATVLAGIPGIVAAHGPSGDHGLDAARALMTTDTHPKQSVAKAGAATVGGLAKGAAMLAPNMATMLAVLTTDAAAEPNDLQEILRVAVNQSFNVLTVDGCTSTNDTVILMASGKAGPVPRDALQSAVSAVCHDLAGQMAGDAEGATKVVRLQVTGADSDASAAVAARKIAESQLVKCSWYGQDPYWGRLASEAGSAGIAFSPETISVSYGGITVARGGVTVPHDEVALRTHMAGKYLDVIVDLGIAQGNAAVITNDLTHAYIDENMGTS